MLTNDHEYSNHICIGAEFCYQAAILDASSRKALGAAISKDIDAQPTLQVLRAAAISRQARPARDRGVHSSQ